VRPFEVLSPSGPRSDPYYWLRDDTRKNTEMLGYLAAENAYADQMLEGEKPLAKALYGEIIGRIAQDDATVPYFHRGYWYYTRFAKGEDYPVYARKAKTLDAPEEVMLDGPAMAKGHGFFQIGATAVSQDGRLLAFAKDDVGRRQFVLRIKDLSTGQVLADEIPNVEANLVWSGDGAMVFYIEKDPVTLLSKRVKAHVLGTPASEDRLVYEEKDDSYYMSVSRTRDDAYICIDLGSTVATEKRCAPADHPHDFAPLSPRLKDHLYDADHLDGRWVVRTNWSAPNYRLMALKDAEPWGDRTRWAQIVPADPKVFIEDIALFHGVLVTEERSLGLRRLRLRSESGGERFVTADEPAYAMGLASNEDVDASSLNYTYASLTTPVTTYRVDLRGGARVLLKRDPVPGYDPANYVTERVWITARDGVQIPVSLAYKKGFKKNGHAAMLQYAYGSYGVSSDPRFSPATAVLLDKGLVYALAHIRGGQEMGRAWYDDGHLLKKMNTFNDFIDVTRGLVAQGYAAKDRVAAQGGSAGGLLMGAVANMAPFDYKVIIAQVPFVDVVTTMLDESIPLTTNEFNEWGDPKTPAYYNYMLSYSPYDNVGRRAYPALFVTTGLFDSQVQYYEPTKWVAKLRAMKTDANPLVLRVNMQAGHGGKSGRFERYKDTAEIYAFMLDQLGLPN
jgi:oligopeptidase B